MKDYETSDVVNFLIEGKNKEGLFVAYMWGEKLLLTEDLYKKIEERCELLIDYGENK